MRKFLGCLLAVMALAGCAIPYRIPVSEDATQAIRSSRVLIVVEQKEIVAEYVPVNTNASAVVAGMPFVGLLGAALAGGIEGGINAAINAERFEKAQQQAAPIREATQDYDFDAAMQNALKVELARVPWLKTAAIETRKQPARTSSKQEQLTADMTESAVLILNTRYSLTPGARAVHMSCDAFLVPKSRELKEIVEKSAAGAWALYRNKFSYTYPLPVSYEGVEHAVDIWSADKGGRTRTALNEGIAELARMIALDLQIKQVAQPEKTDPAPARTTTIYNVTGVVISETAERALLRLANGELHSVSKSAMESSFQEVQ